jgi:hypothetical protein
MLDVLRAKAIRSGLSVATRRQDFRRLTPWPGLSFDAVICPGASLSLVADPADVDLSLRSMLAMVAIHGGVVVIGLHNYALLRDHSSEFELRRPYSSRTQDLAFDARIFRDESVEVIHTIARWRGNRWRLTTSRKVHQYLGSGPLAERMLAAGFRWVRFFDITGSPGDGNGEWVLVVGGSTPHGWEALR